MDGHAYGAGLVTSTKLIFSQTGEYSNCHFELRCQQIIVCIYTCKPVVRKVYRDAAEEALDFESLLLPLQHLLNSNLRISSPTGICECGKNTASTTVRRL